MRRLRVSQRVGIGAVVGILVMAIGIALVRSEGDTGQSPDRGRPGGVLTEDGRVGPFLIDRSTASEIIAAYGDPDERQDVRNSPSRVGYQLVYFCTPKDCPQSKAPQPATMFGIASRTASLSDFSTESLAYRTARGSRIGMPREQAEMREGVRAVSACLDSITRVSPGARMEIGLDGDGTDLVNILYVASTRNSIITC